MRLWSRQLGVLHRLATRNNNLAVAYQAAGRLGEAVPLFERTLADRERVLGESHPATLGSRSGLAAAYRAAGWLDEPIPLFERTLGVPQLTNTVKQLLRWHKEHWARSRPGSLAGTPGFHEFARGEEPGYSDECRPPLGSLTD